MNKNQIVFYVALIYLLLMIIPAIKDNLNLRIAGFNILHFRFWSYITIFTIIIFRPKIILNKSVLFMALFLFLVYVMQKQGHLYESSTTWIKNQIIPCLTCLMVLEYFLKENNTNYFSILGKSALLFIAVSCILNIVGLIRFPIAARNIYAGNLSESQSIYFTKIGILGYSFSSGLPPLIPTLFYQFRNSKRTVRKVFTISLIILIYILIILASIAVPLIIATMAIITSIFIISTKRTINITILIVLIILLFLFLPPKYIVNGILDTMIYFSPSNDVDQRLSDLKIVSKEGIKYATTARGLTTSSRFERVYWNLSAFSDNIIFGSSRTNDPEAYHLFWLYLFASFGIVGGFLFLSALFYGWKSTVFTINREFKPYYLISILSLITMGLLKNVIGDFMFAVPIVIVPSINNIINVGDKPVNI